MNKNQRTNSKRLVRESEITQTESGETRIGAPSARLTEPKNHPSKMVIFGLSPCGAPRVPGSKRHIKTLWGLKAMLGKIGSETDAR